MPPIFHLDEYDNCLEEENGIYCTILYDVIKDERSELYTMMEVRKHLIKNNLIKIHLVISLIHGYYQNEKKCQNLNFKCLNKFVNIYLITCRNIRNTAKLITTILYPWFTACVFRKTAKFLQSIKLASQNGPLKHASMSLYGINTN